MADDTSPSYCEDVGDGVGLRHDGTDHTSGRKHDTGNQPPQPVDEEEEEEEEEGWLGPVHYQI